MKDFRGVVNGYAYVAAEVPLDEGWRQCGVDRKADSDASGEDELPVDADSPKPGW